MSHTQRVRRAASVSILCAAMGIAACSEPTSLGERSWFTADVQGATTTRITGSAAANAGGDWSRESVVQVTLPNVGSISGIVLSSADRMTSISFLRSGSELSTGTFLLGRTPTGAPVSGSGGYSGGYLVRRSDGLQLFTTGSGTLTITESGNRVIGTFTLHVDQYEVIPFPTQESVGKPITPLSRGQSPLTITGTFDAGRR